VANWMRARSTADVAITPRDYYFERRDQTARPVGLSP
jgi:hypothetical protein